MNLIDYDVQMADSYEEEHLVVKNGYGVMEGVELLNLFKDEGPALYSLIRAVCFGRLLGLEVGHCEEKAQDRYYCFATYWTGLHGACKVHSSYVNGVLHLLFGDGKLRITIMQDYKHNRDKIVDIEFKMNKSRAGKLRDSIYNYIITEKAKALVRCQEDPHKD